MSDPTKPVPTHINDDGHIVARVTMTPISNKVRAEVDAPPDQAIPIVFVPGIMGSPLLATGNNIGLVQEKPWAWFPDSYGWVVGLFDSYRTLSPAQRKTLLDPENTRALSQPEDADLETITEYCSAITTQEAQARGWGSVMLRSYGEILNFLEMQLRFILTPQRLPYPGTQGAIPRKISDWGEVQGYSSLTTDELQAASEFRYPVYAVGYNWLQSNDQAANYLAGKIREILDRCRNRLNVECRHGVILVTHSMGGLVARMCAKRHPELIQGIVHGVQPAIGAGTAYRRVRAGWEDMGGSIGLGGTGKKIIPVFANSAGALELLPNQRYGAGWLRVNCNGSELFRLPVMKQGIANPYEQIYLKHLTWWRLIDPIWINPVNRPSVETVTEGWTNYQKKIALAEKFHLELNDYYHPNSFVHYGADDSHKAFHTITWKLNTGIIPSYKRELPATRAPAPSAAHALALRLTSENHEGRVWMINDISEDQLISQHGIGIIRNTFGDKLSADLQGQDQAGDGTVPAHAAEDAAQYAKFAARMTGYDHQNSYKKRNVQNLTLYSILRIGATAEELAQ